MCEIDRMQARKQILAAVREMAKNYPNVDYCYARERFGLLGRIRAICKNKWPTAKECWEGVGLDRTHLVDEFEFTQSDVMKRAA